MAESNENQNTNQADVDLAKVQDFIRGQVQQYAQEIFNQASPAQPQRLTAEEDARRRLGDALDPFIAPGIHAANLNAADAKDYIDFYLSEPSAVADKEQVEVIFRDQINKGRPLPRKDIYQYVLGKQALADPEAFGKKLSSRQKKQIADAESGADVGLAALDRARTDPVWSNVRNMGAEELRKALDGITF